MKELSGKASVDIISERHQDIYEIAKSFGGSAKPSGAGGGDLAMALVPLAQRNSFIKAINGCGFCTLDIDGANPNGEAISQPEESPIEKEESANEGLEDFAPNPLL